MQNMLFKAGILGAALSLSLAVQAAMTDAEATAAVVQAIEDGRSGDDIIQMLRDDGRSLDAATVLAVEAATGPAEITLARAGICAAQDISEAELVGNEVLDVINPGQVADQVRGIMETYETTGCAEEFAKRPPPGYSPTNTGLGGGSNVGLPRGLPGKPPIDPGSPSS